LLALGLVSREAMMRWRGSPRPAMATGTLVITGLDKTVENRAGGGFAAMAHRSHDAVLGLGNHSLRFPPPRGVTPLASPELW
jgi:hypothetical protein